MRNDERQLIETEKLATKPLILAFSLSSIFSLFATASYIYYIGYTCLFTCPTIYVWRDDLILVLIPVIIAIIIPLNISNSLECRNRPFSAKLALRWSIVTTLLLIGVGGSAYDPKLSYPVGMAASGIFWWWPIILFCLTISVFRTCRSYRKNRLREEVSTLKLPATEKLVGSDNRNLQRTAISLVCVMVLVIGYVGLVEWPEEPPYYGDLLLVMDSTRNVDGSYKISVITVSPVSARENLEAFQFYLKNDLGRTVEDDEIGLQNISGQWHGIDITWDNETDAYSDPNQAQIRINAVKNGNQTNETNQKSEGTISVSFLDNDLDGKLTAGDVFIIQGNSAEHPADDDWSFDLKYDLSGPMVGSVILG